MAGREIKTHQDLRALEGALTQLANHPLPPGIKAPVFNAFQLRVLRAIGHYRAALEALHETEQQIIDRYRANPESKMDPSNPAVLLFGPKQLEYVKEMDELGRQPVDMPAAPVSFAIDDFNSAGIGAQAAILEGLGPLFTWPQEQPAPPV